MPVKNSKFQTVKYKVFKPTEGMTVTIKSNGNETLGEVLQTESHRNVVDTVYISIGGNTSKLVICNGRWQVWGYMVEHTVFFGTPDKDVTLDQDNPVSAENQQYNDIAGV
jgi:hypothetical protein